MIQTTDSTMNSHGIFKKINKKGKTRPVFGDIDLANDEWINMDITNWGSTKCSTNKNWSMQ